MSISTTTVSVSYTISGSFPQSLTVTFPFQASSDLSISVGGTTISLNSDYTVSGGGYDTNNNMLTGSVSLLNTGTNSAKLTTGSTITISRLTPVTQTSSFASTGLLTPKVVESALDKVTTKLQEIYSSINSSYATSYVNVRAAAYGAKGDGATDDSAAFTAAFAAAKASGYSVFIPPGTYKVKNLSVPSQTQMFGVRDTSILLFGGTTSSDYLLKNTGLGSSTDYDIFFHDLTFNGNGAWYPTAGVNGGGTPLLNIDGVTEFKLINCRITNYQYQGLSATSTVGAKIVGNEFDHLGYTGAASGTPINDNFGSALFVSHVTQGVTTGVSIIDNYVHDCHWHGIHYNGTDGDISMNRIFACKECGIFYPCDSRTATNPQLRNTISFNKINGVRLHSVSAHGIEGGAFGTQYIGNTIIDLDGAGMVDNYGPNGCVYIGNYFDKVGQILNGASTCIAIDATVTSQGVNGVVISNNIFNNTGSVPVAFGIYSYVLSGTSNTAQNVLITNNIFLVNFSTAQYLLDGGNGYKIIENVNAADYPNPRVFSNINVKTTSSTATNSNILNQLSQETIESTSSAGVGVGPMIGAILKTGNVLDRYPAGALKWVLENASGSGSYACSYVIYNTDNSGTTNEVFRVYGDGKVKLGYLPGNYANDAAAAGGGVPVNGIYRNGSVLMIRTV